MKKLITLITASALAVTVGLTAFAKGHGYKGFPKEKIVKKLDLNETQTAKLDTVITVMKDIHETRKESGRPGPLMLNPEEVESLLADQQLDQARAMQLIDERLATMRSNMQTLLPVMADFTDSLSTEQRAELQEIMEKRAKRHGKRHKGKYNDE